MRAAPTAYLLIGRRCSAHHSNAFGRLSPLLQARSGVSRAGQSLSAMTPALNARANSRNLHDRLLFPLHIAVHDAPNGAIFPKPDGGVRKLGVPCVVDRLIRQAVLQVLQEQ